MRVVLPASGCEMIAKVRRLAASSVGCDTVGRLTGLEYWQRGDANAPRLFIRQ